MIRFNAVGLVLSLPVVRALLDNSAEGPVATLKPCLSVGINQGNVCATDGHTMVRFERAEVDPNGRRPEEWNGRYWPRGYVEARVELAGRKGPVVLEWSGLGAGAFPLLQQAEPDDGADVLKQEIGLDTRYLARLETIAKACRREREPADHGEWPPLPAAVLTSIAGVLDPMRFVIGSMEYQAYMRSQHTAWFTIMPLKLGHATGQPKVKKPRAKKARAA